MGDGPVKRVAPPSWKLAPPHDEKTQGLMVSGFADLPAGRALLLCCGDPPDGDARAWLRALATVAPITDADGRDPRAAAIAFTYPGLERLGLGAQALASFSAPFREGMFQEDRLRRLGDRIDGAWQKTVIADGPLWSGNTKPRTLAPAQAAAIERVAAPPHGPETPDPIGTDVTVHALLLLYAADEAAAAAWAEEVTAALKPHGAAVVRTLSLDLHPDVSIGFGREHFGFADGISQPLPYDDRTSDTTARPAVLVGGQPAVRDRWHGVPLGEFLFGHVNAHHEKAPGPLVPDDARAADLGVDGAPAGFRNFGLDGSYLVVRELRQDVPAFWTSMADGAAKIRAQDPNATQATASWLAERVVGRSLDGHLLCPGGYLPSEDGIPRNDFGYLERDPVGLGCPSGAHVRRGNPRDGLAKDAASVETLLDAANSHRILRRGRKYGPKPEPGVPDSADRGLLFMCLNTDIARQFEFVQQTWVLNTNFATLFEETDPLIGPKGDFTIKDRPLRRIVEVDTFVEMVGGEYFFLPSLPALHYLATP